jgi:hypothetical protein
MELFLFYSGPKGLPGWFGEEPIWGEGRVPLGGMLLSFHPSLLGARGESLSLLFFQTFTPLKVPKSESFHLTAIT